MSLGDQFVCGRIFPRVCGAYLFTRSDVIQVETGGRKYENYVKKISRK